MNFTVDMLYRELRQFLGRMIMLTIWTESGKYSTWHGPVEIQKFNMEDSNEEAISISMTTGSLKDMILDMSNIDEYGTRTVSLGKDEEQLMFDIKLSDSSTITFTTRTKKPSYTDIEIPEDYIKYLFHLPIHHGNNGN